MFGKEERPDAESVKRTTQAALIVAMLIASGARDGETALTPAEMGVQTGLTATDVRLALMTLGKKRAWPHRGSWWKVYDGPRRCCMVTGSVTDSFYVVNQHEA